MYTSLLPAMHKHCPRNWDGKDRQDTPEPWICSFMEASEEADAAEVKKANGECYKHSI